MSRPERVGKSRVRTAALVPYRGAHGAKTRLSGILDEAERAALSIAMLQDVLSTLLDCAGLDWVVVISPTAELPLPSDSRLRRLPDPPSTNHHDAQDGINAAVAEGQRWAVAAGASRLLVIPADVPLAEPADIEAILSADAGITDRAVVVVVPDDRDDGTNALLLRPPNALATRFGRGSFQRHRSAASEVGVACVVCRRRGLELDVDRPVDLLALAERGAETRAANLVRELGLVERLRSSGVARRG